MGGFMKKLIIIVFALTVLFFISAQAEPKEYLMLRRSMENAALPQIKSPYRNFSDVTSAGVIVQRLDHDSKTDSRTFNQRYWKNSSYANSAAAPILFYICGEGACGDYAVGGQVAAHAQKLGANIFALEHRYYGKSQPFTDLSTEHLKFLTTDFALKDLLAFQSQMIQKYNLTGRWITIGGSYPGSLSAYARALYPKAFSGALASSAPVMADLNFSEYDEHIAQMAGEKCLLAIQSTVAEVENEIVSDEGFARVKSEFAASPLRERDDFLYLLADTAAAAVQYGMREQFCHLLEQSGRSGYVQGVQLVAGLFGDMVELSAQAAENISLEKHSSSIGMRQWFYQSCTEYGYWQNASADRDLRARSEKINSDYHARLCDRLFNIKSPAAVDAMNAKFYQPVLSLQATNIYFTNGSEDPWLKLSINQSNGNLTNPNLTSDIMAGAAHCNDLLPGGTSDVIAAKQKFFDLSLDWLKY